MGSAEFVWPVRVYYEDTDAAGVVYYANYLKYLERARTEWLRAIGFDQSRLSFEQDIVFAVRWLQLDYRKPARFDDRLEVRSTIADRGRASLQFAQRILRPAPDTDDELLCDGSVKVACLGAADFRPRALPDALYKELIGER